MNRARERRRECIRLWDGIRVQRPFADWLEESSENTAELWCAYRPAAEQVRDIDEAARALLTEIKSAMDAAVLAAAVANVGLGLVVVDRHAMPLCLASSDFSELPHEGWLMGLRPDQMNVVRDLQPFAMDGFVGFHMRHFALALRRARSGGQLVSIWAGQASPQPNLPQGYTLSAVTLDEPGTLDVAKRLATLEVNPRLPEETFTGNPSVALDPILNVPPWPVDSDDNLSRRVDALLVILQTFIEVLEASTDTDAPIRRLTALDAAMASEPVDVWLPVQFDLPAQEQESRQAIRDSDQGLAIYVNDDGVMTYLALRDGWVVGREIPAAEALPPGEAYGIEVESAVRAAAGRWGLPDFVLRPRVVAKGNGRREVGDGTILSGSRGIALQVKARCSATPDTPERARSWLLKNGAAGLRQARGTIRSTLRSGDIPLDNLRGRPIRVAGNWVEWVPVVVLDHPNPPQGVFPARDAGGPSVIILRRDWEFLWTQLRSASAIVEYIHRVSAEDEPVELGSETHRYFDLANKDLHAPPSHLPDWMDDARAHAASGPLLPKDPASAGDELGFRVFQRILEDIAGTDFTGDETERVQVLSYIDRVAVTARADLGRLLLRRLITCGDAPVGELRVEHRILYIDQGELHLSFTCMGMLTGYYHEMFRTWLLHRRQRFLAASNAKGPIWPWSVGVLLTPRPSGGERLWDTTVIATNGPPEFEDAEYRRLDALYTAAAPGADVEGLQAG